MRISNIQRRALLLNMTLQNLSIILGSDAAYKLFKNRDILTVVQRYQSYNHDPLRTSSTETTTEKSHHENFCIDNAFIS